MYVACHNKDCLNYGASYTVEKGDKEAHDCSICGRPLTQIVKPDELLAPLIAERAEAEAEAQAEAEAEVASLPIEPPSPREQFLAKLDGLPPAQVATVALLAEALRAL